MSIRLMLQPALCWNSRWIERRGRKYRIPNRITKTKNPEFINRKIDKFGISYCCPIVAEILLVSVEKL